MYTRFATAWEYPRWQQAIRRTHWREVEIRVLDLEHRFLHTLPPITDGQRTINVTRTPTRTLEVTVFDPRRTLSWEPDGATDFTYMRRMLQVVDRRLVSDVGWLDCPVFTGPVSELSRESSEVSIVAEGKERLALGNFAQNRSWGRKYRAVEVIREIMLMAGEHPSRIHLPPLRDTLPEALNITRGGNYFTGPFTDAPLTTKRTQTHWAAAQKIAKSMGYFLFYDGAGHLRMRQAPRKAVLTLDERTLMSAPRTTGGSIEVRNRWIVQGSKPKGNKTRVGAMVALPARHDLSAQKLGRNGEPRWLDETITASQASSSRKVLRIATDKRDEQMRVTQDLTAESLPIPNLEEWDLIRVIDPETGERPYLRLKQETLPLTSGEQSLGTARRVTAMRGKGGARRHWGGHFKLYWKDKKK